MTSGASRSTDQAGKLECQLRAAGRTIVLISHDVGTIPTMCDRAMLLHHGRVIMVGTPTDVIDRYQRMALGAEDDYHLDRNASEKSASCSQISFAAADQGNPVRTGYPMFAPAAVSREQSP